MTPHTPAPAPCLAFSAADLPALRARIQIPPCQGVWEALLEHAVDMSTPGAVRYLCPDDIDAPAPGLPKKKAVIAHAFGRRLFTSSEILGFAYVLTGEDRFAEHGRAVLVSAARKLPVTDPRVATSLVGGWGDIMRGFALGLDWLGAAMPAADRETVEMTAAGYVRAALATATTSPWWMPYHNFMGVTLGAAGCLAIALRTRYPDEAPAWIAACAEQVRIWLDKGFDAQGGYGEGTHYAHYGLHNATLFAAALHRHNGEDLFAHPHLQRVPHFYAMSLLPGERVFDARNDAPYANLHDPFLLALAAAQENPLARWLWNTCGSGHSPLQIVWHTPGAATPPADAHEPLAEHFTGRGLCVARTGWSREDVLFAIEAGPFYPITHNQADKGHFTLYGLGHRWAIDSGYGNNQEPGGRDQTVAHNCVLVDGEGQALSGAGLGTDGRILAYQASQEAVSIVCDATSAYNRNNRGHAGAGVRHAYRGALFLRPAAGVPAYACVADDIRKDDAPHEYTWLLHTDACNEIVPGADGALIRPQAEASSACLEIASCADRRGAGLWTFRAERAGAYALWARVRMATAARLRPDMIQVMIDDGPPLPWPMQDQRRWTWTPRMPHDADAPPLVRLEPGAHRIQLMLFEADIQVHDLALVPEAVTEPEDFTSSGAILLTAEAATCTGDVRVTRLPQRAPAPRMKLRLHADSPITIGQDTYDDHPRLWARTQATNPRFAALLLPLPHAVPDPLVEYESRGEGLQICIHWPRRMDIIFCPTDGRLPLRLRQAPSAAQPRTQSDTRA